jgi:NADH-quinone oxidoreductase subunit A
MQDVMLPILLFVACALGLALVLLGMGNLFNPSRRPRVKQMPYESGMDPIHDARRRFDVRFHLLAIAFLVFDVELLFLYPWAVAARPAAVAWEQAGPGTAEEATADAKTAPAGPRGIDAAVEQGPARGYVASRDLVFAGVMVFLGLLALGFVYDWRKGIFRWR